MQCKEHNIDNIFLSGAGSTVILLTSKKKVMKKMFLEKLSVKWRESGKLGHWKEIM